MGRSPGLCVLSGYTLLVQAPDLLFNDYPPSLLGVQLSGNPGQFDPRP